MKSIRTRAATLTALVVGLAIAGSPAKADLVLQLTEPGEITQSQTVQVPNNQGPAFFSGTLGDFSILISTGTSNSPGTVGSALGQVGTVNITNNSGSAETLEIGMSALGFTSPSGSSLSLIDTVSGSVANGTVTGTFQGFGNSTDSQQIGTGTAGSLLSFSASGPSSSFAANGGGVNFTTGSGAYSLSIFSSYTLSAGATMTLTGGNVQVITPEPGTMASAVVGLGLLGGLARLRRRRAAA